MLYKKSSAEITQAAIRNLIANTDLRFFGAGSISKSIVESIARELELVYESVDINLSQARLSTASGAFLDIIASQFGERRLGGSSGTILAEDQVVRFYVTEGRLVDFLGQTSTTAGLIPQGTTVSNRNNTIIFVVPEDVAFPANATTVWVPVTPSNPGAGSANNVSAGVLVRHSLNNSRIYCENTTAIIVGTDPETDDELRLRLSRKMNARVNGSRTAILEAAFSFPGVSDIRIHPYKFGAGSFEILIVPTGSRVTPNILANIKAAVDSVVPYGIKVGVRGPDIVPISLVIQIDLQPGILTQVKTVAIDDVTASLRRYLGEIPMGGELIINRIRSIILDSNSAIRDLNILELIINCRPQVIANYKLREDEVFDLDRKVEQPLLII